MSKSSQEHKQPKTVVLSTAILTNVIVAFVFIIAGLISGYFFSMNVHNSARQSVVSDIEVAKTASKANQ